MIKIGALKPYLFGFLFITLAVCFWLNNAERFSPGFFPSSSAQHINQKDGNIPDQALKILNFINLNGSVPKGYVGGSTFYNREKKLPQSDVHGTKIHYKEWDIHPKREGKSRGPQRLVTGSDGNAWYTADHYNTFSKINQE